MAFAAKRSGGFFKHIYRNIEINNLITYNNKLSLKWKH